MEPDICDEPSSLPVPDTVVVYMSLLRYPGNIWMAGPTSTVYSEVCRLLRSYTSITAARVYPVTVPCEPVVPTL